MIWRYPVCNVYASTFSRRKKITHLIDLEQYIGDLCSHSCSSVRFVYTFSKHVFFPTVTLSKMMCPQVIWFRLFSRIFQPYIITNRRFSNHSGLQRIIADSSDKSAHENTSDIKQTTLLQTPIWHDANYNDLNFKSKMMYDMNVVWLCNARYSTGY